MMTNSLKLSAGLGLAICLSACATSSDLPPPPPETGPAYVEPVTECDDRTFSVYFASGETTLDDTARQVIEEIAESEAECTLSSIVIEGHSDASGSADVNLEVSRARARAVQQALLNADLQVKVIEIAAMGETDALTADGLATPMNRMVRVRFEQ